MSEGCPRLPTGTLGMARPPLAETRIQAILDNSRRRGAISRPAIIVMALALCIAATAVSLRAVAKTTAGERGIDKPGAPESSNPDNVSFDSGHEASAIQRLAHPSRRPAIASSMRSSRPNSSRLVAIMDADAAGNRAAVISAQEANSGKVFRADSSKLTRLSNAVIHWGAPQNGLQTGLAIEGDQNVFAISSTIVMHAYWRNASKKPIEFAYAWYAKYEMLEEVQTASGGHVDLQGTMWDIPPIKTSARLKPGEAVWAASPEMVLKPEAKQPFEPTAIVRPGKYRVRIMNVVAPWEGALPANTVPSMTQPYSDWIPFEVVDLGPGRSWGVRFS
jgi:hypothetical protein